MKPDIYHLDYETFSPVDIKDAGAFKYAEHPEAEILILAIAKNDEPVRVWDAVNGGDDALMLLDEAAHTDAAIWAHNAQFEFAITKSVFHRQFGGLPIDLEQWHCTAALCRLAAIPSSLAGAGEYLEIEMPKDTDGKRLINKFCVPRTPTAKDERTRIFPHDDPADFRKFVSYCVRDVEAERQVHAKLKMMDMPNPGQKSYRADLRMNDRGIPVNIEALRHADQLINLYTERLIPKFRKQVAKPDGIVVLPLTKSRKYPKVVSLEYGFKPSQNEVMKAWLKERGFTGDDLQATTVEAWQREPLASQLTEQARIALQTYSLIGSAAVKKIPAMLNMACADGYVRGALMIYGAERTHRWTGKGIQPQNFARPTIGFTELAYHCICNGATITQLEDIFGDLFPIMVSCIRHFIQPHDGKEVLQADYSAIEARVAPWLVDAEAKLEAFRKNEPIYENMAGKIFHKPAASVTKDERFLGKQAELGCTYNMGRPKFRGTCESYGFSPSAQMVEDYKPHHAAFTERAVEKVRREVARKFERKGMAIPAKYDNEDFYIRKACQDNKWANITPSTPEQWASFAFDELADRAVTTWRNENPIIVASWRKLDDAAKAAIADKGSLHTVGKLSLAVVPIGGFDSLCMKLPSGHYLVYPKASVVPNESKGWGTQVRFWGVIPNSGGQWGWCYTYGGKLLENATQAAAGDVMREGMLAAEAEGYEPFMLVHDEMLATKQPGQTHERLCELLCTMPAWAKGLPLAAEGSTIPFYKK